MRFTLLAFAVVGLFALAHPARPSVLAQTQLSVTAVNKLKIARPGETIELTAKDLATLTEKDLNKLHVLDSTGKEVLSQSVDADYDDYHKPVSLIFQADLAPGEPVPFTGSGCADRP